MKRLSVLAFVMIMALFCLGMGGVGGEPEGTVPETDVRIQARVIDRTGTVTNLNQFSMDGKTHLDAIRGQGKLTIPFQHIETVTFTKLSGDNMDVAVKLKSGNSMDLAVRQRAFFYGSTGFGAFRIKARDVASIEFP